MSEIGFLGAGAMGARMASKLLDDGHVVRIWNRTVDRVRPLVERGAKLARSPREAATNADFVFSMVRDDEASHQVWLDETEGALAALPRGAVAIECSTLSLSWIRSLHLHCEQEGHLFLEAPVAGSRPQADQRQLIFFAGGSDLAFARSEPVLSRLASAVHHAGGAGAGMALKLAVNAMFGIQVAALAEVIGMLHQQEIDVKQALEILAATPVFSPSAKGAALSMATQSFAPMFPVELVVKDFGYILDAATSDSRAPLCSAAADLFDKGRQLGLGEENITAIVQLFAAGVLGAVES